MPILNYSTKISAEKTIAEIQKMLAKAGAKQVLTDYDDDAVLSAISFRMLHQNVMVSFRLPANIDRIQVVITRDSEIRRKFKTREQASRIAWRIVKDWIEAQLAIVEAEQAEMVEVFLPYAQNPATGETLFEQLSGDNFKLLEYSH